MTEPCRGLLLIVPPDWDAEPQGLAELRRSLAEDHAAYLMLRPGVRPMHAPLVLWVGWWEHEDLAFAQRELRVKVEDAFVDLSWLALDEVG